MLSIILLICYVTLVSSFINSNVFNNRLLLKTTTTNKKFYAVTDRPTSNSNINPSDDSEWIPSSWKSYPIAQPPNYPSQDAVNNVVDRLTNCAPLVFAGEVRTLQEQLAKASMGQGFVLMGGDCAESFSEFCVDHVRDTFRVILQMALILTFGGSMPVIKIGRMAGQFAKPRSEPDEVRDGIALPSYRGDILNGEEFTPESRIHNPERMMDAYHHQSCFT